MNKQIKDINNELDIEINEKNADGIYSNLTIISHSTSEFVLDFARLMPGQPKAQVKSRIIVTPENAKRLLLALQDNISRYEQMVGKIETRTPETPIIGGFSGIES
ncbi:MAG: DUF3467 domain-containing protein [Rikenellaceae bacterium]